MLCMQEVDTKVFRGDLDPVLTANGFSGEYAKKGGQVQGAP